MTITTQKTSPHVAACEELLDLLNSPRSLTAQPVESLEQLRELWLIDKEAYQDCSLDFAPFVDWWQAYPPGSTLLLELPSRRILASIGIYPLTPEQALAFTSGDIPEGDLRPMKLADCRRQKVSNWYCSGIVVIPEMQNKGLLRRLLQIGIGSLQQTGYISYPATLYGLAEYTIGEKLLTKFGFSKLRDGSTLPDGCDLYGTRIESERDMKTLLQAKGF